MYLKTQNLSWYSHSFISCSLARWHLTLAILLDKVLHEHEQFALVPNFAFLVDDCNKPGLSSSIILMDNLRYSFARFFMSNTKNFVAGLLICYRKCLFKTTVTWFQTALVYLRFLFFCLFWRYLQTYGTQEAPSLLSLLMSWILL